MPKEDVEKGATNRGRTIQDFAEGVTLVPNSCVGCPLKPSIFISGMTKYFLPPTKVSEALTLQGAEENVAHISLTPDRQL